jgi:glycosyltransferase involved in cell wall biosynthesis
MLPNSPTPPLVSVIINFFNPDDLPRLNAMVTFSLECMAAYTEYPLQLILVDGSGKRTPTVADRCAQRGWTYLECPHKGAFARIYNQGMEAATGDYRVWMASDIFVTTGWEKRLISEMQRTGAWMAAPYLTNSDYPAQVYNWVAKMRTFRPTAMTFNLNMITRECFERVGGMDDRFTGNFNDIDYLVRIRRAGGEAIVVNAGQILHMARATSSVASTFKWDQDRDRFLEKYPDLKITAARGWGSYDLRSRVFSRSRLFRGLVTASGIVPAAGKLNTRLIRLAMRFEPLLHAV